MTRRRSTARPPRPGWNWQTDTRHARTDLGSRPETGQRQQRGERKNQIAPITETGTPCRVPKRLRIDLRAADRRALTSQKLV